MSSHPILLGPLMRYVDQTSASIWVETRHPARVVVRAGDRCGSMRTFAVHGHHYALVDVDGLAPGSVTPYTVEVDGTPAWPLPGSPYPPSVIATLRPGQRLRMTFGSCRTHGSHDEAANATHGVDALRALAQWMAGAGAARWPDLVLFLGDQVYADETTGPMRQFIAARRDIGEPPGAELKDFEEYAHLYRLAWGDPLVGWLLSTLPSMMIFDDHDVRDDWNTSLAWRRDIEATSWWQERIVSGLGSYWVYQHLGNLAPAERAVDPLWRQVLAHDLDDELDLTAAVDELADRANRQPQSYRWSFARDFDGVRLVVVDSRAARLLQPGQRSILHEREATWLDGQMRGGVRHLLVGTSLPFLLPSGLHHLEAWNEAVANGAWGRRLARFGERLRQAVDLEHWAAFQRGFRKVAAMATAVADGRRGEPPQTVTFLSGDVHHSFVSEVRRPRTAGSTRIVQAVCSPIRNPLKRHMRLATAVLSSRLAGAVGAVMARSAGVPAAPLRWHTLRGPWFDNTIATVEDRPDGGLGLVWQTGVVSGQDHQHPALRTVAEVVIRPQ